MHFVRTKSENCLPETLYQEHKHCLSVSLIPKEGLYIILNVNFKCLHKLQKQFPFRLLTMK